MSSEQTQCGISPDSANRVNVEALRGWPVPGSIMILGARLGRERRSFLTLDIAPFHSNEYCSIIIDSQTSSCYRAA